MSGNKVEIVKTETFADDYMASDLIDDAINEFVDFKKEKIVNIQMVDRGGKKRFWIYVMKI